MPKKTSLKAAGGFGVPGFGVLGWRFRDVAGYTVRAHLNRLNLKLSPKP